jgi:hypothetical protein
MYSTQKHFRYTEIAKPKKKTQVYTQRQQTTTICRHHVAKTEEKIVFASFSSTKKHTTFSLHATPFCLQQNNAWILLNCSLEHQQRLQLYTYSNKILIHNLFFFLVICVYLKPLCSLGHDWDLRETTLERWIGDL